MAQPSWIGRTLNDRYEIQELLGQGGMAAVYKAFDHNLKRVVAVKLIHPQFSSNEEFVRRFESEASTVAQLRHPNIIQIFDFTHENDVYFIVFEFIPGETLQARMKRLTKADRQMEISEAVNIAAKTCDALHYAHTKGLIHRDIKPANIMLNVYGEPIVMDFGIAKIMGGTQHTATGAVLGTARYMSPEQIKGDRIDPRSDEYSLGVTLFEMLGGRPPFEADSAMTLMMMHMTDPVPDLRNLRAEVPAELASVVNKSLAKNRDDRYETSAAMAYALRNYTDAAPPAGATTIEQGPVASDPGKTVLESAALGAAVATTKPPTPSADATVVESTSAAPPAAPPPRAPAPTQPAAASSGPNWLLIGGAIVAVIAILAIAYFAFIRPSGDEGTVPPIAEVTETPAVTDIPPTEVGPTDEPDATEIPATDTAVPEPTEAPVTGGAVDAVVGDVKLVTATGNTALTPGMPIPANSQIITNADSEIILTLDDGSILQLTQNSGLGIKEFAEDATDETQASIFQLNAGNLLLSKPEAGNILEVLNSNERPLAALTFLAPVNASAKTMFQSKRLQQDDQANFMGINIADDGSTLIACFFGDCTVFDDQTRLLSGSEISIDANGQVNPPVPINENSISYQYWQTACEACLPEMAPPALPPTATSVPAPATLPPPTTPPEPTAVPTEETTQLSVRITGINDQNGTYIVNYETYGYTEQLPGQHVHFYFDTVSEANAGSPGSGPWKLYGGPRPFTQYTVSERPSAATAMCARVANADHSIIYGSGNCWPLP